MQKEIDIDSHTISLTPAAPVPGCTPPPTRRSSARAEKLQKLRIVELRLQQIVERDLGARPGDTDRTVGALDAEDAHLVARDGEIDLVPRALRVACPGDEDAAIGQVLGGVFEGAELGDAARAGEFAFVVPLLGEGHEEAFLALFVLQRHHRLLDVVVVRLELAFEVRGLVVETREREFDALEFALALHSAAVLGADVDGDGVEEVLVVVVPREAAVLFEAQDVLEGGAFEFCVRHGGDVD